MIIILPWIDYACSFSKNRVPRQGWMYLSMNYICFYSFLMGKEAKIVIPYIDIMVNARRSNISSICKFFNCWNILESWKIIDTFMVRYKGVHSKWRLLFLHVRKHRRNVSTHTTAYKFCHSKVNLNLWRWSCCNIYISFFCCC